MSEPKIKKDSIKPPRLADWLFEWHCGNTTVEDLRGDVEEMFHRNLEIMPAWKAKLKYWQQILSLLFSYAIRKRKEAASFHAWSQPSISMPMMKNNLKIAVRSMRKNKQYTLIKTFGLAIGISACLIVYLIANFELGFDRGQKDAGRIYRIYSNFAGTSWGSNPGVSTAVPDAVRNQFSGVDAVAGFRTIFSAQVRANNAVFDEQKKIIVADPGYFMVFQNHVWLEGAPSVLNQPFTVVLTEKRARTYFGDIPFSKMVGKEVVYDDSLRTTVAGIVSDLPFRSDFNFTEFISFPTITRSWLQDNLGSNDDWTSTNSSSQCFIRLGEHTSKSRVESQLTVLDKKYAEKNTDANWKMSYHLQHLPDIHFNFDIGIFDNSREPVHLPTLKILMIISMIILLVAIVNFVNIESARAVTRMKEVGIRKAIGSSRASLVIQLLSESALSTTLSVCLSIGICLYAMNVFFELMPPGLHFDVTQPGLLLFFLLVLVSVTLLAGLYPAAIVSSFQPVRALKSLSAGSQSRSLVIRKALIVFQFAVAQALIIGALVGVSQIRFMLNKDLGFRRNEIVLFHAPWRSKAEQGVALKAELDRIAGVADVCRQWNPPAAKGYTTQIIEFNAPSGKITTNAHQKYGDVNYVPFYQMKLLAGRNVSEASDEVVINDAFRKKLDLKTPADAIGIDLVKGGQKLTVVGVVADFHFQSMHSVIAPMSITYRKQSYGFALKIASGQADDIQRTIAAVRTAWEKVFPNAPFEYTFLNDNIRALYEGEERTSKLTTTATVLAILISCMGLYGLSSFTSLQRTKEIGVRKVLGASVRNIVVLLSKEYLWPIAIAFLVAAPLSYTLTLTWLEKFAYHIDVSVWILIMGLVASLIFAAVTVGSQSLKSASANPVDSLRYE